MLTAERAAEVETESVAGYDSSRRILELLEKSLLPGRLSEEYGSRQLTVSCVCEKKKKTFSAQLQVLHQLQAPKFEVTPLVKDRNFSSRAKVHRVTAALSALCIFFLLRHHLNPLNRKATDMLAAKSDKG